VQDAITVQGRFRWDQEKKTRAFDGAVHFQRSIEYTSWLFVEIKIRLAFIALVGHTDTHQMQSCSLIGSDLSV
jgi:hypothetical protein